MRQRRHPELADGESLVAVILANRHLDGRSIGGRLYLTDRRFIFEPARYDRMLGSTDWSTHRGAIVGVDLLPRRRGFHVGGGALENRARISIRTAHGNAEVFLVSGAAKRAAFLRHMLDLNPAG